MDFKAAQHDFVPSAMQGIAKGGDQAGRSGWDDVGGLLETRRALQEVSKWHLHTLSYSLLLVYYDQFGGSVDYVEILVLTLIPCCRKLELSFF